MSSQSANCVPQALRPRQRVRFATQLLLVAFVAFHAGCDAEARKNKLKPVGDPDRIRDVLQAGKTYRIVIKAGFQARVEDKQWGLKSVTNIAYEAEAEIRRKIESNDGKRIVELRTFDQSRTVKLLYVVEGVKIDLGAPGTLLLSTLSLDPEIGSTIAVTMPLIEGFLTAGAQAIVDDQNSKAFRHVDSLTGKSIRITYVDGQGVVSIEPVGCTLNENEQAYVNATAVVSDCYIFPNMKVKPGESWKVDGSQFAAFIDPSLRGVPSGEVVVVRKGNSRFGEKEFAILEIERGRLEIDSSEATKHDVGSFIPRGTLEYNIADGFIQTARLSGDARIEQVSKDHLLFETSFRTSPKLTLQYSCEILP